MNFKPIPFWTWNDMLDKDRLELQMRDMAQRGFGGFFIHARSGMKNEYMSEEWFDFVGFCIEKSEELGLDAWIYDENGWPSGFCGGELLKEEFLIAYLQYNREVPFDKEALANYIFDGEIYIRVKQPIDGIDKYYSVKKIVNNTYVDLMNPNLARAFVECTHERYKQKFGNRFKGFFTDEPQYSREGIPWSIYLKAEYEKRHGKAVEDDLIYLFESCGDISKAVRFDYYSLACELFVGFQKYVYEWCNENGYMVTGHTIDENHLFGQVACCGAAMQFYEYEHIPGIDWLTRHVGRNFPVKQCSSVAEQLGRKQVLTESFAAGGWNCTPPTLKRIADFQIANGVNLFCFHMYPYSLRGERKRDYPPFFSEHNSWMREGKGFTGYLANVGEFLGDGDRKPNVLVLHPITGAYLTFERYNELALGKLEEAFEEVNYFVTDHQIPYHFGDEVLMKKYGRVENGRLIIGECAYDYVLIPDTPNLTDGAYQLLREYVAQGGKLLRFGDNLKYKDGRPFVYEDLQSNVTKEEVIQQAPIQISDGKGFFAYTSKHGDKVALFLLNYTDKVREEKISVQVGTVAEYDLVDKKTYQVSLNNGTFATTFQPFESKAYILGGQEGKYKRPNLQIKSIIDGEYEVVQAQNYYPLDIAEYSTDGIHYSEPKNILQIRRELLELRHNGKVYIKRRFVNKDAHGTLWYATEPAQDAKVFVNGTACEKIAEKRIDDGLQLYNLSNGLNVGENIIIEELTHYQREEVYYVLFTEGVSETMLNKLVYDTEIDLAYLIGEFEVQVEKKEDAPQIWKPFEYASYHVSGFTLTQPRKTIDLQDLILGGYPFKTGRLIVKKQTGALCGYLNGDFSVQDVCVSVNGKSIGCLYGFNTLEINEPAETNELTLDLAINLRNLFGPFHAEEAESYCVIPNSFYETVAGIERYSITEQGVKALYLCADEEEFDG